MIMIEIKVAILFVVNPHILHHYDYARPSYHLKRRYFVAQPVTLQYKSTMV